MRRLTVLAALVAAALWGTTALAGEKIKLPSGPAKATMQVTPAIQHGSPRITNVDWARRAWRNGWNPGYVPYYTYRPYTYGYVSPYYGGYYTSPYYGYSYYAPGAYYGGPRVAVGVGPLGVPRTVWW
ncbi:MAG: hypothetical protein B7Z73_00970 [Planctomycetia bacterium 21-64-5]|nr:MAG: hypothetical protein B7Z73_00970 [Planctomycetia bacterium 21-64-5]HQU42018.1 hypothetical protein [Pirellulales bacterium]